MRSETSVLMISDEGVVNGMDGKSTVSFGLQIKNGKGKVLSNFENNVRPIVIYFDALTEGEGGGCSAGGSFSIVSHGQTTLHAVGPDSKVVSSCFVGSLKSQK
jgi:hypothetical protein